MKNIDSILNYPILAHNKALLWDTLTEIMDKTFRFTSDEREAFYSNKTAQLIGAIPFAAGCDEPERTAIAHLSIYVTEKRGYCTYFDHNENDNTSPFIRLRHLMVFKDGNMDIIAHGMTQLALIMVEGYQRSKETDRKNNQYNPLNDGAWDAEKMKQDFLVILKRYPCKILEDISSSDSIVAEPW